MPLPTLLDASRSIAARASQATGNQLSQLNTFVPTVAKAGEDEDRHFFTRIAGVPTPFPQVGTFLGLDTPFDVAGIDLGTLLVDILLDPATYLNPIGGLSKMGRAGALLKSFKGAKNADDVVTAMSRQLQRGLVTDITGLNALRKSVQGAESTDQALDAVRALREGPLAQRAKALNQEFLDEGPVVQALSNRLRGPKGSQQNALQFLDQQIGQRRQARDLAVRLASSGGNPQMAADLAKQIRKLDPARRTQVLFSGKNRKYLRDLIDVSQARQNVPGLVRGPFDTVERKFAGTQINPLTGEPTRAANVAKRDLTAAAKGQFDLQVDGMRFPQRSLVSFKVPGMGRDITVLSGQGLVDKLPKRLLRRLESKRISPFSGLVPGAKVSNAVLGTSLDKAGHVADADTVFDAVSKSAVGMREDLFRADRGVRDMKESWVNTVNLGEQLAAHSSREITAAFDSRFGDLSLKAQELMVEMVDEPSRFLNQPKNDKVRSLPGVREGRFGKTALLGEASTKGLARASALGLDADQFEEVRRFAEAMDSGLRQAGEVALENGVITETLTHYFPRKVIKKGFDDPKVRAQIRARVSKKDVQRWSENGLPRRIPTLRQLKAMEKEGLIELEKNPAKLVQNYFSSINQAVANARFQRTLHAAPYEAPELDEKAIKRILGSGKKTGLRVADEDVPLVPLFVSRKDPLSQTGLYEAVSRDKNPAVVLFMNEMGREVGDPTLANAAVAFVHRDISRVMNLVAEPKAPQPGAFNKLGRGLLLANSAAKRSLLGLSAFHFMALTESAVATLGSDFLKAPIRTTQAFQRQFHQAGDLMRFATSNGLQVGPMTAAEIGSLSRVIQMATRTAPEQVPGLKQINELTGKWDKALWDYTHNGMKMFAFHTLYQRALVRHPDAAPESIARGVSEHVNNAFGGQVWENLLLSKQGLNWARGLILAPDWTASNLRVAGDVFANFFKRAEFQNLGGAQRIGAFRRAGFTINSEDLLRSDIRAFFARQYAMRVAFRFGLMANLTNAAFTGHFMFQNDEGHRTQIELPWKDEAGRKVYWKFGKQFREPLELVGLMGTKSGPDDFLKRKAAFIPWSAEAVIMGDDYFGRPIASTQDGPVTRIAKRLGYVGGGSLPIFVQDALGVNGREAKPISTALLGALGAPIRTEFKRRREFSGPEDSPPLEIPGIISDAFEDGALQERFRRIQDASVSSRLPVFGAPL